MQSRCRLLINPSDYVKMTLGLVPAGAIVSPTRVVAAYRRLVLREAGKNS